MKRPARPRPEDRPARRGPGRVAMLIALPLLAVSATYVTGQSPQRDGVRLTVGGGVDGDVRQVAGETGKQGNRYRLPRGGRSSTSATRRNPGGGLFGLFGGSTRETSTPPTPPGTTQGGIDDPNWDGVPYHEVTGRRSAASGRVPIRDAAPGGQPTTAARSTRPTLARPKRQTPAGVPTPPADVTASEDAVAVAPIRDTPIRRNRGGASATSSRRADRRVVDNVAAKPRSVAGVSKAVPDYRDVDDLVPRVTRRRTGAADRGTAPTKIAAKATAKTESKKPSGELVKSDPSSSSRRRGTVADASGVKPSPPVKTAKRDAEPVAVAKKGAGVAKDAEPTAKVAGSVAVDSRPKPADRPAPVHPTPAKPATQAVAAAPTQPTAPAAAVAALQPPVATPTTVVTQPAPTAAPAAAAPALATTSEPYPNLGFVGRGTDPSGSANGSAAGSVPPMPFASNPSAAAPSYQTASAGFGRRAGSAMVPPPLPSTGRRPSSPSAAPPKAPEATAAVPTMRTRGQWAAPVQPPAPQLPPVDATARRDEPVGSGVADLPALRDIEGYRRPDARVAQNTPAPGGVGNDMRRRSFEGPEPGHKAFTSELPGLRVITHGPEAMMIRETREFEIRVENRGSIDARGVLVRTMIPEWADLAGESTTRGGVRRESAGGGQRLTWTIDELDAGQSQTMFVRLTARQSGQFDLNVDWTLKPNTSIAKIHVHEPKLKLTIDGPDEIVYGESKVYKVRVLNPGDGPAPNVVFILSPGSTPQTQRIGEIPPGKEAQFDVELTAQDLGDLKIHGLATGDLELRSEATKLIRVSAAKLEATLTGPEVKYQNSDASYALEIVNEGSATSRDVIVEMQLPAGCEYLGGIDGATLRGRTLRWTVEEVPPRGKLPFEFDVRLQSTGDQVFAVEAKGSAAGRTGVSLTTRVDSIADLVLTINDPPAPAPVGEEVAYEIVIHNRGSRVARDVRAVAQFSHGIEPKRVTGHTAKVMVGQVLFDPISTIDAGERVTLKVLATAETDGHHRFRTEINSDEIVLVAEEATHYMGPRAARVSRRSSESTSGGFAVPDTLMR